MRTGQRSRLVRGSAVSCLLWLMPCFMMTGPVLAEAGSFDCGREDHERLTEPGEVWFETYHRRLRLGVALDRNGNHDLASRFDECALIALRRAAEFGYREAQFQYGLRLGTRKPRTPESMAEAYQWLKRAADRGHKGAQVFIDTWPKN